MALEDKETIGIQVVAPPVGILAPAALATPIFKGNGNYVIFRTRVDVALIADYIYVGNSSPPSALSGVPLNVGTVDEWATKTRRGQNWYALSTNALARLVVIEKKA